MSVQQNRHILYDGTWRDAREPLIPAESRAVWYGDGCFETFRSYSGRFLKLEAHFDRLLGGLEYLRIPVPQGLEEMRSGEQISRLLEKNGLQDADAVVRVQVWREGPRGFGISESHDSHYIVTALPMPEIPAPVRLAVVSTRRIPSRSLDPSFKLSNSINYIKASSEAGEKDADDALMLTVDGFISETPVANIFWYGDGKIRTPSAECDILPGITRSIVMQLLRDKTGHPVELGRFTPEELMEAEEVWICNSVRELVRVGSVDGNSFRGSHPLFTELKSRFKAYKDELLS